MWLDQGFSLVAVAKLTGAYILDVDDPKACVAKGFKQDWAIGCLQVRSPSDGRHFYGLQDQETQLLLGSAIPVYKEKGNRDSGLILELKLNRSSVAAPTAERKGQKKVDGIYQPLEEFSFLRKGLHPDLLAWIKEHGEIAEAKSYGNQSVVFSNHWDQDAFLTHHHAEQRAEGEVDGTYHIAPFSCPVCDKVNKSTLRAAAAKFIFSSGTEFGYTCHACGISSREELERKLAEQYPDFKPWGPDPLESDWVEEAEPLPPFPEARLAAGLPGDFEGVPTAELWHACADTLDEIRKGTALGEDGKTHKLPGHVVDEKILTYVIETLTQRLKAKFFVDAAPYIFLPGENRIIKFQDDGAYDILSRLRLRAFQRHNNLVYENLRLHILKRGESTHVEKFGCMRGEAVYVNNGRGGIFKITVDDIIEVPNGTDSVYMINKHLKPWPKLDKDRLAAIEAGGKVSGTRLCRVLNACFEEGKLTAPQYQQLVLLRWLALFLGVELRPILLAIGPQNSGKSTLWEKIMWLFYGTGFSSQGMPTKMQDFIASVTNHQVQLYDNIDRVDFGNTKSDYPVYVDIMCKCATGGTLSMRVLFKDNIDRNCDLRCNLFLTSRVNPFPSHYSDLLRRTLIFPFRLPTKEEHRTVEEMKEEINNWSDDIKLETLVRLQSVLTALLETQGKKWTPKSEMASFEIFTRRVAEREGWGAEMDAIWESYRGEYQQQLTADSPFVQFIRCWVGKPGNVGRVVRAGEIYKDLEKIYGKSFTQMWRTNALYGRRIKENFSALGILGIKLEGNNGGPTYSFRPSDEQLRECENAYSDTTRSDLFDWSAEKTLADVPKA